MQNKNAGVVGLGLIGGSIAKALKQKLNMNVVGIDINKSYTDAAFSEDIISHGGDDYSFLRKCDIVFLCYPVIESIKVLPHIIKHLKPGCILTDVGSTKMELVSFVKEIIPSDIHFIGGHPMTGSEKSGYFESKPHLFENAYYILTPYEDTDNVALTSLIEIIRGLGAIPIVLSPQEHDYVTAAISHVPHIIASNLVNTIKTLDTDKCYMQKLAAGGFKDITRIASSDPTMWQNICFSNGENICKIIDSYIDNLNNVKGIIKNSSSDNMLEFFNSAKNFRDNISSINKGVIKQLYNLFVDVEDKPGVIGNIATLLGDNNVNITNIGISNSREFQPGCLVISFNEKHHYDKALNILKENGHGVGV